MLLMISGVLVALWLVFGWLVVSVLNLPPPQPQPKPPREPQTRSRSPQPREKPQHAEEEPRVLSESSQPEGKPKPQGRPQPQRQQQVKSQEGQLPIKLKQVKGSPNREDTDGKYLKKPRSSRRREDTGKIRGGPLLVNDSARLNRNSLDTQENATPDQESANNNLESAKSNAESVKPDQEYVRRDVETSKLNEGSEGVKGESRNDNGTADSRATSEQSDTDSPKSGGVIFPRHGIDSATWPAAVLQSSERQGRRDGGRAWQREAKEQGRRMRLLQRRRRLISRLYDPNTDAVEILSLYFRSPSASRSSSPHPNAVELPASPQPHSADLTTSSHLLSHLSDLPATLRRRSAPLPSSQGPGGVVVGRGARVSLGEEVGTPGQEVGGLLQLASSDDSGISVGGRDLPASPLLHCQPTIFGTVADETTPRDNTTKRGLPQTPKSGAKSCPYNGVDTPAQDWPPTPDDDNSLVYEDGVLVSGSLQALVQHAVPTAVYYPDTAYLFAFLLSSRLFIKPHDLLQRVCDVGFTQQGLQGNDLNSINKEKLGAFVPHMVQLLGEWSETFPYDFRDERMMGGVRTMTHRCIALQPSLRRDVTQVLHNLLNKLTQLERYEESQAKLSVPPPADFIPQPIDITEVCQSPLVMAQQLTHIELEKLSYIGPEEFVQAFAKDNLDACYKDLKKTSNLECYIQWFNRLSYLVATHACTHVKRKQRVRVIEWWIEVARECFNIGNFNSLMGIIAGLNMSIVSRLKKTWSKVQSAKFSVLEHQMDPSSNFSSYRSTLKAAMWRSAGAVDDRQKIVIPFFSLLVKDLYFLNEGCASRLPNGHINFDKFWQLAKQVTEFMAWKQVSCPFEKVHHVITHLQTAHVLTETGLALASFECEGPDNSYEKERYKNLKSDTQPPPERE